MSSIIVEIGSSYVFGQRREQGLTNLLGNTSDFQAPREQVLHSTVIRNVWR